MTKYEKFKDSKIKISSFGVGNFVLKREVRPYTKQELNKIARSEKYIYKYRGKK